MCAGLRRIITNGWSTEPFSSEISVYNLGICNSTAFSMGQQRQRGVDCRAVWSLVFIAQLKIAALKQAIISPLSLSTSLPFFHPHRCSMKCLPSFSPLTPLHLILPLFLPLSSLLLSPAPSVLLWEPLRKSFAAVVFYPTGGSYQPGLAALQGCFLWCLKKKVWSQQWIKQCTETDSSELLVC